MWLSGFLSITCCLTPLPPAPDIISTPHHAKPRQQSGNIFYDILISAQWRHLTLETLTSLAWLQVWARLKPFNHADPSADASPQTCLTFPLWLTKLTPEQVNTQPTPALSQSALPECFLLSIWLSLFSQSRQLPSPSVSLLWLMSFPSCCLLSIKKEKLPIPLTLTWLFPLNTHENTQAWQGCSLSYFSQIPLRILPFSPSFKVCLAFYSDIMTQAYISRTFAYLMGFSEQIASVAE